MYKFYFSLLILIVFSSCSSKPDIKDFDRKKLELWYTIDLDYTREKLNERKENDSINTGTEGLALLLLSASENSFMFGRKAGVTYMTKNHFNSKTSSHDYFEFKIENDSVIFIKDYDDYGVKENDSDTYVKSAILLEYDLDYEYFIFKVTQGSYKNLEFKAIADH